MTNMIKKLPLIQTKLLKYKFKIIFKLDKPIEVNELFVF